LATDLFSPCYSVLALHYMLFVDRLTDPWPARWTSARYSLEGIREYLKALDAPHSRLFYSSMRASGARPQYYRSTQQNCYAMRSTSIICVDAHSTCRAPELFSVLRDASLEIHSCPVPFCRVPGVVEDKDLCTG